MSKEANLAAQESLADNLNNGDLDAAMQSFAPDAIDRDPAPGQASGRDGFKAFFVELTGAFPDAKLTPEKIVADEDSVALAYTLTGTHRGEFHGIAPTEKTIKVRGLQIGRFAGGQIVERWGSSDELGIMQQLGADVSSKGALGKLADKLGG